MAIKTRKDFSQKSTLLFPDKKTGVYHTRFMIDGRSYFLSTKVRDFKIAGDIAYRLYCERLKNPNIKIKSVRSKVGALTCGELCKIFLENIVAFSGQHVSKASANSYVKAFERLVSVSVKDWESFEVSKILPAFIDVRRAQLYSEKGLEISKNKDLILNYSVNSDITQALSVFSISALDLYESKGYNLRPVVSALKKVRKLPSKNPEFAPVKQNIDALMIRLADVSLGAKMPLKDSELELVPNPQVAVVFELARFCGLTVKEIKNLKWSWCDDVQGRITIAGNRDFSTKRNSKDRIIPVSPDRIKRWKTALGGEANDFVIDNPIKTQRTDIVERDSNKWIKSFIGDKRKGVHEMRKMATSDFLRSTNGDVFKVAKIIGDDPRTMLKYYAAVLDMDVKPL